MFDVIYRAQEDRYVAAHVSCRCGTELRWAQRDGDDAALFRMCMPSMRRLQRDVIMATVATIGEAGALARGGTLPPRGPYDDLVVISHRIAALGTDRWDEVG